jgi:hypothetical protein
MYLAQKESDKFNVFQTFLDEAIKNGNSYYMNFFKEVLRISKLLTAQEIDFYKVDPDFYEVVKFLVSEHSDFIDTVDIDSLTITDLTKLKGIFEEQEEKSLTTSSWITD